MMLAAPSCSIWNFILLLFKDAQVFTGPQGQAEAQETHVKATRACGRAVALVGDVPVLLQSPVLQSRAPPYLLGEHRSARLRMRCCWGEYSHWNAVSVLSSIRNRPSRTYLKITAETGIFISAGWGSCGTRRAAQGGPRLHRLLHRRPACIPAGPHPSLPIRRCSHRPTAVAGTGHPFEEPALPKQPRMFHCTPWEAEGQHQYPAQQHSLLRLLPHSSHRHQAQANASLT